MSALDRASSRRRDSPRVNVRNLLELERALEAMGKWMRGRGRGSRAQWRSSRPVARTAPSKNAAPLQFLRDAAELFNKSYGLRGIDSATQLPELEARRNSAVSWAVKALVEATPISGRHGCRWRRALRGPPWHPQRCRWPQSWSRGRSFRAERPGCRRFAGLGDEQAQCVAIGNGVTVAVLAGVVDIDGQTARRSIMYLPVRAECQLVPQAAMLMLDAEASSSSAIFISPR